MKNWSATAEWARFTVDLMTPVLAVLLALPASAGETPSAAPPADPAAAIQSAIARDWIATVDESGSVVVTSPAYPMRHGQGCVIHRLYFPAYERQPALGDLITEDRYHVFASGEACGSVAPELFFTIEPGNDVVALLDFGRRLKSGPRDGRDRLPDSLLPRIAPCFAPAAMATTRIARAHAWRPEGSRRDRYQATLECKALADEGQIVATGTRDEEAVTWEFRGWNQRAVDVPAGAAR